MLVSKGMSLWGAALWSVTTSIPQPLMAIAAYSCVDAFVIIQPIGLGFAAGAMLWVAWLELFVESYEVRHRSRREPSGAPNPTPPSRTTHLARSLYSRVCSGLRTRLDLGGGHNGRFAHVRLPHVPHRVELPNLHRADTATSLAGAVCGDYAAIWPHRRRWDALGFVWGPWSACDTAGG